MHWERAGMVLGLRFFGYAPSGPEGIGDVTGKRAGSDGCGLSADIRFREAPVALSSGSERPVFCVL